jgi:hypothetical protein
MSPFRGSLGFGSGTFLPRLLNRPAATLTLEDFRQAGKTRRRGGVGAVQPQLSSFFLRPNTSLRLHYPIEARLAALFESRYGFAQGLASIQMENWNPLRRFAAARARPLFDGEKAVGHWTKCVTRKGSASAGSELVHVLVIKQH